MRAFLPGDRLKSLLTALGTHMDVVAPQKVDGAVVFASWKGQEMALQENSLLSPLEFLLPQRDVLFRYTQDSGRYSFAEPSAKFRLIFGIRSCDLCAVAALDKIFGSAPADHPYFEKRRSTVLVALNCTRPAESCSCSSSGSGPECRDLFDLLLTEVRDGYLAETGSAAGIMILKEHPDLFLDAKESHLAEKQDVLRNANSALPVREERSAANVRAAMEKADWDALGLQCLNCGSCTFVCPVCHCFSIFDAGVPDGERVRCRDTCLLSGFSRMAGGANPRISQGERLHNWYLDKFEYIPQKTGLAGCVGCGRCSRVCLAQMDRWSLEVGR